MTPRDSKTEFLNSAAKQQISWVVSLWWSPLTFVRPGVPKKRATTAPSSQSKRHLTVFCIDEIVPGYVVYLVNAYTRASAKSFAYIIQFRKSNNLIKSQNLENLVKSHGGCLLILKNPLKIYLTTP